MFKSCRFFVMFMILTVSADDADIAKKKVPFTFGPYAVCCVMPALGDVKSECFDIEPTGTEAVCSRSQCAFEDLGFLTDNKTLNKETYKRYLLEWAEKNKDWSAGVNRTIADCIDKDLEKSSDPICNAYDVYACTGISMILKCPKYAWICA